jgi:hypothetical protein
MCYDMRGQNSFEHTKKKKCLDDKTIYKKVRNI